MAQITIDYGSVIGSGGDLQIEVVWTGTLASGKSTSAIEIDTTCNALYYFPMGATGSQEYTICVKYEKDTDTLSTFAGITTYAPYTYNSSNHTITFKNGTSGSFATNVYKIYCG